MPNTLLSKDEVLEKLIRPLLSGMRADFARDPAGFQAWWIARQQQVTVMGETMALEPASHADGRA